MIHEHADHFESSEQRAHAARLGMWVFLGSELLLFAGLFALYAGYRAQLPVAFAHGIADSDKWLGSLNTAILLLSSALVALAVHSARQGRSRRSVLFLLSTMACGGAFLTIKLTEYAAHVHAGILPGGAGRYFAQHGEQGLPTFWTLYYLSTGLHAIHVAVGLGVLAVAAIQTLVFDARASGLHRLENCALYWHLIDVIWIFLWPLYYLG